MGCSNLSDTEAPKITKLWAPAIPTLFLPRLQSFRQRKKGQNWHFRRKKASIEPREKKHVHIQKCNFFCCFLVKVHGSWSTWTSWSMCTVSCAGGKSLRRRYCNNPRSQFGGENCQGAFREKKTCNEHTCPGIRGGIFLKKKEPKPKSHLIFQEQLHMHKLRKKIGISEVFY